MIGNCVSKYFKSVLSCDNDYVPDICFDGTCSDSWDVEISASAVLNLLVNVKLDSKKSPGPDGIPNFFLHCYSL